MAKAGGGGRAGAAAKAAAGVPAGYDPDGFNQRGEYVVYHSFSGPTEQFTGRAETLASIRRGGLHGARSGGPTITTDREFSQVYAGWRGVTLEYHLPRTKALRYLKPGEELANGKFMHAIAESIPAKYIARVYRVNEL